MPVIAIVNQKGGTGKTTLSINLACAFALDSTALLLDADAQGSSQDWAEAPGQRRSNLEVIVGGSGTLLQDARRMSGQFDWVIIDGPSGIGGITADAIRAADLVLIPAKASPFDVWAAADIVAAVRARQEATGGPPRAAFVVTMSRQRTLLGRQVEKALQEYGLPALAARTTERVSYPQMAAEGRTVLEGRDQVARREILDMRAEIERLLNDTAR